MNKLIGVAALAVAPLIFTACGDPPVEATPTTVKPTIEYRIKRVNVFTVPQACLDAIDVAEEVFAISADVSKAASEGFYAAADFDVDGIRDAGAAFRRATADLQPLIPRWQTARDDCKAAN